MKHYFSIIVIATILSIGIIGCSKDDETDFNPNFKNTEVTLNTYSSIKVNSSIEDLESSLINETGFCWNLMGVPTLDDNKVTLAGNTNLISSEIDNLPSNQEIHIRPYCIISNKTYYGSEATFTLWLGAKADPIKDKDGNVYQTVKIGNQVWMQENLRTTKYNNGDPIETASLKDDSKWVNATSGMYCNYNDDKTNNTKGLLYNYNVITDARGITPENYKVSSSDEWSTLISYLGGYKEAAYALRSFDHWNMFKESNEGISGFNAIPSGWRAFKDQTSTKGTNYTGEDDATVWWTYDPEYSNRDMINTLMIKANDPYIASGQHLIKQYGVSIRCIKAD